MFHWRLRIRFRRSPQKPAAALPGPESPARTGAPGLRLPGASTDDEPGSSPPLPRPALLPQGEKRGGIACPNCGAALEKKPLEKTACRVCGENIHVRARQRTFPSGLVAERDINAIDFLENIEPLGITEPLCQERLAHAPNERPTSLGPLLLGLCRERLTDLPWAGKIRLLHEMARFCQWEGKDDRPLLREAALARLRQIREAGGQSVVLTGRGDSSCPACRALAGTVLEVERALAGRWLPVDGCTSPPCRCLFTRRS